MMVLLLPGQKGMSSVGLTMPAYRPKKRLLEKEASVKEWNQ